MRLGGNINCEAPGADWQGVADWACDMKSPYMLLLDDYKSGHRFGWQLYRRSPETKRIHRLYLAKGVDEGWEGSLMEVPNGQSSTRFMQGEFYAQHLKNTQVATNAPEGTLEQVWNEPDYHGERLKQKNRWTAACMREATKIDLTLVVDNSQQRSITVAEVEAGYWDDLILAFKSNPRHKWGVHAYGLGILPGNISNAQIARLATPGAFSYQYWKVETPEEKEAQRLAYINTWHESHLCSGTMAIIKRFQYLHIPPPEFVVTEYGHDDVYLGNNGSILRAVTDMNGGIAPRGFPSLTRYLQTMLPELGVENGFFKQYEWADVVELPEVKGLCAYSFDTSFGRGSYHLWNVMDEFLAYSKSKRGVPTPPKPPKPPMTDHEILMDLVVRVENLERGIA